MSKSLGRGLGALIKTGLLDGDDQVRPKTGNAKAGADATAIRHQAEEEARERFAQERAELEKRVGELEEERKQLIKAMDMMEGEIESMIKDELAKAINKERERIEEDTRRKFEEERRVLDEREDALKHLDNGNFEQELQKRLRDAEEQLRAEVDTIVDATEAQVSAEKDAEFATRMAMERSRIEEEMRSDMVRQRERMEQDYLKKKEEMESEIARTVAERERELRRSYGEKMVVQQQKIDQNKKRMNDAFRKKKFFFRYRETLKNEGPLPSLELLNKGIRTFPEDEELYDAKAQLFLDMGHLNLADAWSRRSLRLNAGYLNGWLTHAAVLERREDYAGAASSYRTVLSLDPKNSKARVHLSAVETRLNGVRGSQ